MLLPFASDAGNGGSYPGLTRTRCCAIDPHNFAQHDEAIGLAKSKWLKQDRVDHAEDQTSTAPMPSASVQDGPVSAKPGDLRSWR